MVKSHISACSWQLGRHSQIPNPKWSNPKSQMVKSQILNGQIPNPKWSNPKRSNPKSLPAVSNWAAISISVLRQKVLHRLGERGRDLPQSFFSFTSRVHIWKISVLTAYRCCFFFSPSLIPRWVPWMNQMNFHEMQEKKEKAISLPPNSEPCHKQLNESSSNEFQLKDIFSERS